MTPPVAAAREPSAAEVIAEALLDHGLSHESRRWECDCGTVGEYGVGASLDHQADAALAALKAAGFVVATRDEIRAMSPSEQAELIRGEVEERVITVADLAAAWNRGHAAPQPTRVVGPWREVQP